MLVRICGSCGRKVLQGQRCECQKDRFKVYTHEHRDKDSNDFYSSAQWKAVAEVARSRAGYADEYVLCYEHKLMPGKVVHHIIPIDEAPGLRVDLNNMVCVSAKTHRKIHDAYASGSCRKAEMQARLRAIRRGRGPGVVD